MNTRPRSLAWDATTAIEALAAADTALWVWTPSEDQIRFTGATRPLGLGPLAGPQGLAAPLILGQDVLRHLVLDLDAPERRLRFSARDGWTPPAEVRPIAVTRNGRALQAAITVEGAEVQAVVDTGASAVLAVTRETARAAGLLDGRDSRPGQSIVLGGVVRADTVVARTLTIGDDLHRDAEVAIYDDVAVPGFPKALIGMEAFAGRRLALDLGGPRLFASRALDITVGGPEGR